MSGVSQVDGSYHTSKWHAACLASLSRHMHNYLRRISKDGFSTPEGHHLTQGHLLNHQVAKKWNQGDQGQVLKDQKGRRNTKGRHSSQSKDEVKTTSPSSISHKYTQKRNNDVSSFQESCQDQNQT
ncbi:hypothetical protein YC2023_028716 [Brassica napus]